MNLLEINYLIFSAVVVRFLVEMIYQKFFNPPPEYYKVYNAKFDGKLNVYLDMYIILLTGWMEIGLISDYFTVINGLVFIVSMIYNIHALYKIRIEHKTPA